jgi:hypothetical protein
MNVRTTPPQGAFTDLRELQKQHTEVGALIKTKWEQQLELVKTRDDAHAKASVIEAELVGLRTRHGQLALQITRPR